MNSTNAYTAILIILTIFIPAITWGLLRKRKHWSHSILAWIALLTFLGVFAAMNVLYNIFLKSDCNDCEQAQGLVTAVVMTPISTAYLVIALIFSISWLIHKMSNSRR